METNYVVYFIDTNPDTGDNYPQITIAYTELEQTAKVIAEHHNRFDLMENREYKYSLKVAEATLPNEAKISASEQSPDGWVKPNGEFLPNRKTDKYSNEAMPIGFTPVYFSPQPKVSDAIEFAEWIKNSNWAITREDKKWVNFGNLHTQYNGIYTTAELYTLFSQPLNPK